MHDIYNFINAIIISNQGEGNSILWIQAKVDSKKNIISENKKIKKL
jgi:hypothetical protein